MSTEEKIRDLIEFSVANIITVVQKGIGKQSFAEIVSLTTDVVHSLGTTLIEEIVTALDEHYNMERDRHAIIMRNNKSRRILTKMGEVTLSRRLYYDKSKQQYFFAVDELLDIERRSRIDPGLKQELIANATLTSYGKASEIAGHKVSRQTVHNIVKKLPQERVKVQAQGHRAVNTIFIEADEDHIHLNTGKPAEVKLVYVHEGSRKVCQGRTELVNPKYFTSVSKRDDEIWSEVFDYVCSQYQLSGAEIHLSGDGAQWIKNGLDFFPKAKYHLDKFHVYKSITDVAGVDKAMRRSVIEALKQKDFNTIQNLYSIRNEKVNKPRERKYIAGGLFYIENNFDEIDLSRTYSCAAEGHVSHVLSARLSSRPMGWSIAGAGKMAALRAYYFNGGDFSTLIERDKSKPIAQNNNMGYNMMMRKTPERESDIKARVVGVDGKRDYLSTILRAVLKY